STEFAAAEAGEGRPAVRDGAHPVDTGVVRDVRPHRSLERSDDRAPLELDRELPLVRHTELLEGRLRAVVRVGALAGDLRSLADARGPEEALRGGEAVAHLDADRLRGVQASAGCPLVRKEPFSVIDPLALALVLRLNLTCVRLIDASSGSQTLPRPS